MPETKKAPAPRLACSTSCFWMWELDRAFGAIAEAGFDAVELMVTRDPDTQASDVPRRLAKQEGVSIVAVHAPMLVFTRRVWGPNFLHIIERSGQLAKGVGAGVVVVHPPYLWELRYQAWLLGQLDHYREEHGIVVSVENMFHLWVGGRPVRGHRWVSPSEVARFPQITLDTSHCGVDGQDILEALERVGHQTAHIHLSDNLGQQRDSHALPGTGILPLEDFVKRLPDAGFEGALSLELDLRDLVRNETKAVEALRRARDFCAERLP
jgi:sugar phosphate isomerase/epimerase